MGGGRGGISKTNNGAGAGAAAVGLQSIPAGSRKVVQSLKEIVNCPEPEIYAMLKECNMDPNEAVNRLLTQDPFREVKSKREKKKENKETPEIRSRGGSGISNRGRGVADRYASRGGNAQHVSSESVSHSRPVIKKENGSVAYSSSLLSVSGVVGNSTSRRPPLHSDAAASEVKVSAAVVRDNVSSGLQPSGYQGAWGGVPGQVSMADIVKMGKPQSKVSSAPNTFHSANHNHDQWPSSAAYQSLQFPEDHTSKVSDDHLDARASSGQHVSVDDEWPTIEQPSATSMPSVYGPDVVLAPHPESSNIPLETANRHSGLDEVQTLDDGTMEDHDVNHLGATSVSGRKLEDNAEGEYLFENDLYHNRGPKSHAFDQQGDNTDVSVSSVTANMQQLILKKEDAAMPLERDSPSVVMPDHLQVQSAACSHLSFGTFGSCATAPFSGPLTMSVKANLEEAPLEVDGLSVGPSEARNSEYYADEPLRNTVEGNLYHRAGGTAGNYDSPPASQPEPLKVENLEVDRGNQYAFPSSTPGYAFDNSQQLNIGFSESQTSSQMQNLSPFSNVMPAYTNSLPNSLLAANVNPGREADLPYSPFPATQSMAAKYGNLASSIGGSSISMNEALKAGGGLSSSQPTAQTMSGNNVATGPALPQHLAVPPYSQPALPLGPFANMISYPFLPQNYAYMPSGYQQTYAGNNTYHQSLAAVLPQYKNSVSVSSLPQSAAVASGYGSFGNSTAMPGNFQMNPAAATPSGTNLTYDDVLNAQYKESNHLISLQQSDNSGMWLHGPGSRTMSAVPANTYYNFQGQSQQPSGFRQGQQPSQNYGALGYPNFYHSQTGMSLDHQQQNPRDGSLGGSQGQPKPSQQLWPNY